MSIKIRFTNYSKVRAIYLLSLFIAATFLLGMLTTIYIPPLIANLYTPKISDQIVQIKVVPSPSASPSPSPTPTPPTVVETKQPPKQVQPSERALKLVAYFYLNTNEETQKRMVDEYSGGSGIPTDAIKNFAIYLDKDASKLAILEAAVEQDRVQKAKTNSTSPIVLPQQTFPKNCTSNTIGSYTYTNCY